MRFASSARPPRAARASARSTAAPSRRAAHGLHAVDLLALERRVDAQESAARRRRPRCSALTPTTIRSPRVDLGLQLERGVGDLALRVVALDRLDHAAELVDLGEVLVGLAPPSRRSAPRRSSEPPSGSIVLVTPVSWAMICCVRSAIAHRVLGRQRERLVVGVRVQRLGAAEHAGQRLDRRADDVVERLLGGQRHAGGLRVEAHQPRRRVLARRRCRAARAPRCAAPRGTWRSPRRSRSAR